MRMESLSAPDCLRAFLGRGLAEARAVGDILRSRGPQHLEVLARGSSSHAGTVPRYAFAGSGRYRVAAAMPYASARSREPSLWAQATVLAISQSGRSPDIVQHARVARDAGAFVVGLINAPDSPLAGAVTREIGLMAGPEHAVAATKSVILSIAAGLAAHATAVEDSALMAVLHRMPETLEQAATCDWSPLGAALAKARATYFVGRGVDLGIAKELALKVAETVGVPSLAFSSAEFLHGPVGAVSATTPVIGIVSDPGGTASVVAALERARRQGASTLIAHGRPSADLPAADLPLPPVAGTAADAVPALVPAYLAIEAAARVAGRDPDRPAGLAKVTETR
jgi:glucosamine--fructose-6-phosphate aminotransferase (isomerizing)